MEIVPYASAIGSMIYVILYARPNVSYALRITSRYQEDPGEGHWIIVEKYPQVLKKS